MQTPSEFQPGRIPRQPPRPAVRQRSAASTSPKPGTVFPASGLCSMQTATVAPRRKSAADPPDAPPASGGATDDRSSGPAAGSPQCAEVSAPNCHTAQTASASCCHHTGVEPHRKLRAPTAPRPRKRIAPSCPQAGSGIHPRTLQSWPDAASAPWDRPSQQSSSPTATTPGGAWTSPSAAPRRPDGHTVASAFRAKSLHTNGQT